MAEGVEITLEREDFPGLADARRLQSREGENPRLLAELWRDIGGEG